MVADAGFDGRVVEVATRGIEPDTDDDGAVCGGVVVRVAAGEVWDDLVATAVGRGWVGVEALSGIPGSVGATPVQNVGAYGQEVSQTIASVRVWDRVLRGVRTFAAADCDFGYRHSRFKADPGRHVVLSVDFQLRTGSLGAPVTYAELARTLGVEPHGRAPLAAVREAVLALRAGKGMVLDDADPDTWSAGSFFTNPFLTPEQAAGCPTTRRAGSSRTAAPSRAPRGSSSTPASARATAWTCAAVGPACRPSTRWRSPTAAARAARTCWRWPARSATASRRRTASGWSTSPCSSAASSDYAFPPGVVLS